MQTYKTNSLPLTKWSHQRTRTNMLENENYEKKSSRKLQNHQMYKRHKTPSNNGSNNDK